MAMCRKVIRWRGIGTACACITKEYKTIRYPVSNYISDEELADELHRIIAREGEKHLFDLSGTTGKM